MSRIIRLKKYTEIFTAIADCSSTASTVAVIIGMIEGRFLLQITAIVGCTIDHKDQYYVARSFGDKYLVASVMNYGLLQQVVIAVTNLQEGIMPQDEAVGE
jgi:hypothetical protein